jgi:rSAM/selenodomain-associated transferase 1
MKAALIIFIQQPLPGELITRSGEVLSEQEILSVHQQLSLHTYYTSLNLPADKFLFYSNAIQQEDAWLDNTKKYLQQGEDLSKRMQHAMEVVFQEGYSKAIIVCKQNIEIESFHLQRAFEVLNDYDIVIGPSQDGGYYLIGMKTLQHKLFNDKTIGETSLLQQTLNDITKLRLTYNLQQVLGDGIENEYLLHHRQ